jgi:iron complex outermembrane receptor protein
VLDQLKNKAALSIQHRIWKGFSAAWVLSVSDRNGTYTDPVSGLETAYDPYLLFDGKLMWEYKWLGAFVGVDNILNSDYRDYSAVAMPGRWLHTGISVTIK